MTGCRRLWRWVRAVVGLQTALGSALAASTLTVSSPSGALSVEFTLTADGVPTYSFRRAGASVLGSSHLGVVRADADFSRGVTLTGTAATEIVQDRYELLTSKRRVTTYRATRKVVHLAERNGRRMDIVFQVSDTGIAFRYAFPADPAAPPPPQCIDATSFRLAADAQAWLRPLSPVERSSEEAYYAQGIAVTAPSPRGGGWAYPALFRSGECWLLISETGIGLDGGGSCLRSDAGDGEYFATSAPAVANVAHPSGVFSSASDRLPWHIIAVGSLASLVESTLGTDVVDLPSRTPSPSLDGPGKTLSCRVTAGDPSTSFVQLRDAVDFASSMNWPFVLVEGNWDQQLGYGIIEQLVRYARPLGVRILLHYSAVADENALGSSPLGRLRTPAARSQELVRLESVGIAGLKVGCGGAEDAATISFYHALLDEAAARGLLVALPGASVVRGWHRSHANLMAAQSLPDLSAALDAAETAPRAAAEVALLPFTRNVFDPVDVTRSVLPRAAPGFSLALNVLLTSGLPRFAEAPDAWLTAPDYVRNLLRDVPTVWDDVQFVSGEPGKHVVLARRADDRWYVAGVNATGGTVTLRVPLPALAGRSGELIQDGAAHAPGLQHGEVAVTSSALSIQLPARGGFVLVLR